MGIGVWLNYIVPEKAFGYVISFATIAGIWTWMMILISQIRYRRGRRAGELPASSFPAPGGAVRSWIALVFIALRHRPHRVRRRTPASASTCMGRSSASPPWCIRARNPEALPARPSADPQVAARGWDTGAPTSRVRHVGRPVPPLGTGRGPSCLSWRTC